MKNLLTKALVCFYLMTFISSLKRQKESINRIVRNRILFGAKVQVTDEESTILYNYGIYNINGVIYFGADTSRMKKGQKGVRLRKKLEKFCKEYNATTDNQIAFLQSLLDAFIEAALDNRTDVDLGNFPSDLSLGRAISTLMISMDFHPSMAFRYYEGIFAQMPLDYYNMIRTGDIEPSQDER